MSNSTVQQVVKQSILYSYVISQPFAVYVDAYPVLQNNQIIEAENLQYGEHARSERTLQHKLNNLSYFDDKHNDDYDVLTKHALKKFQSDHNITVTGAPDKETLTALLNAEKEQYMELIRNLSESIHPGMHGEDVKIIQQALQYFGYYTGEIDGIYGPLTKKALQIAEDEHGIELTKEVTQSSLEQLAEKKQEEEQVEHKVIKGENEQVQHKEKEVTKEKEADTHKKKESESKKVNATGSNYAGVVQEAYSHIGTPYVWGGESPSGFDCSGFIQYIYQSQGVTVPRTVSDTWNFTSPAGSPSVGELVFFETYKPGPSHMGIYIGDGKFIHAGESRGVEISKLNNPYWDQRYLAARKVK